MRGAILTGCVTALLAIGCGKSGDKKEGGGGGSGSATAAAGASDKGGQWADVDCGKMIDHMVHLMLNDPTHAVAAAQKADIEAKLTAQRPTLIKACEDEKPTKRLTPAQYDCILGAKTMMEMSGCAKK
ncbi:MAG: hypothetical protein IT370_29185 [Deltaproteobacteria bacterium]|nr:hypothetical protein [Deltaproteobacteria bacterium]